MAYKLDTTTIIDDQGKMSNMFYTSLHPDQNALSNSGTQTIDMLQSFYRCEPSASVATTLTINFSNIAIGRICVLNIINTDGASGGHTITIDSACEWPYDGSQPDWTLHNSWVITFFGVSSTLVRGVPVGYI